MNSAIRFTYLAQPYSSPNPVTRNTRADLGALAAAWLMQRNWAVHAPIAQGHVVSQHLPSVFAHDHVFWMARDLPILTKADAMHILPIDGWRTSRGLQEEIDFAFKHSIPVFVIQYLPGFDHRLEMLDQRELMLSGWGVEA